MGGLLVVLWVAISFYYYTGSDGVAVNGVTAVDFKRGHDFALLELTPSRAILVMKDGYSAIVSYARGPWCFLMCGVYDSTGNEGGVLHARGDWIYWEPLHDGDAAVNVATGEIVTARAPSALATPVVPELAAHGLVFDEADKFNQEAMYPRLHSLSVQNESCWTFQAAFLTLATGMLIALALQLVVRRQRSAFKRTRAS